MATYVLVHGGWEGGWVWKHVARHLSAAGHRVHTPTLTGLGERAHLVDRAVSLDTHIADILGVIRCEELDDFILCGHSSAGFVVAGVADKCPEKIASLVYLDAFIPDNGRSVFDYISPERCQYFRDLADQADGWRMPVTSYAEWGVGNASDCAWMERLAVPYQISILQQAIELTGAWKSIASLTYIYASRDTPNSFRQFHDAVKNDENWNSFEIACGHMAMVEMPETVARLLIQADPAP